LETSVFKQQPLKRKQNIKVVQKPQFLNNFRLKTAKCGAFCKTCERTNRVIEQVNYLLPRHLLEIRYDVIKNGTGLPLGRPIP
jgi:hypothetical protein